MFLILEINLMHFLKEKSSRELFLFEMLNMIKQRRFFNVGLTMKCIGNNVRVIFSTNSTVIVECIFHCSLPKYELFKIITRCKFNAWSICQGIWSKHVEYCTSAFTSTTCSTSFTKWVPVYPSYHWQINQNYDSQDSWCMCDWKKKTIRKKTLISRIFRKHSGK